MTTTGEPMRSLIHTALYDTGGESVEGAFVDHWVSNASVAIGEMERLFEREGLAERHAAMLRAALREPGAPVEAARYMLSWLKRWVRPLVTELLDDPLPGAREIAVTSAAELLDPPLWLKLLDDPEPAVRAAAFRSVAARGSDIPGSQALLYRAIVDADPRVRSSVARSIPFYDNPEGAARLVQWASEEQDAGVHKAIITGIAEETNRRGIHVGGGALLEGMGRPVLELLLRELHHPDERVRAPVARALQRFYTPEVATAMLERLEVERSSEVDYLLLNYTGYRLIAERALPVLAAMLKRNPERAPYLLYQLRSFGAAAVPIVVGALDDPSPAVRRDATLALAALGERRAIPLLLNAMDDPANRHYDRNLESALRDVIAIAAHRTVETQNLASLPPQNFASLETQDSAPFETQDFAPAQTQDFASLETQDFASAQTQDFASLHTPALRAFIQQQIDALEPDPQRQWLQRYCKVELNALLLHMTQITLWALTPEGAVLSLDHEAFALPTEPERDPLTLFAVLVHGARRYPALHPLIPPLPPDADYCLYCRASGWSYHEPRGTCLHCNGLGWVHRPRG